MATGFLIIILIPLSLTYSSQIQEQKQLDEQLDLVQSQISTTQTTQLTFQLAELEKQLSQSASQYKAVKAVLSKPIGSITAGNILFDIVEAHGLQVMEMAVPGPVGGDIEGVPCSVVTVNATVEGDLSSMVSFISKLNSYLVTGFIKSIEMDISETPDGQQASASISLVIYTYDGD